MPFIEWTDEFSVHEEKMDQQHKMLFAYINKFYEKIEKGASQRELIPVFDKIVSYTDFHFKDEEELLKKNNFPDYQVHKAIHKTLIAEVLSFRSRLRNEEPNVEQEIKQFLKLWLSAHIKGIDTKYSKFV